MHERLVLSETVLMETPRHETPLFLTPYLLSNSGDFIYVSLLLQLQNLSVIARLVDIAVCPKRLMEEVFPSIKKYAMEGNLTRFLSHLDMNSGQ